MMILNTKHFGCIEIEESGIITFEEGLPGFEEVKRYVLLHDGKTDNPFCWLQSVDRPELAFAVINPVLVEPNYSIDIDDDVAYRLGIEHLEDVACYAIVVVPDNIQQMTANLKAPIIINVRDKKGAQVILEDSDYGIRCPVFGKMGDRPIISKNIINP